MIWTSIDWHIEADASPQKFGTRSWVEPLLMGRLGKTLEITVFHRVILISWEIPSRE